jgi:N-acetylglutamate synthase-like GNAT family acetyltransferase
VACKKEVSGLEAQLKPFDQESVMLMKELTKLQKALDKNATAAEKVQAKIATQAEKLEKAAFGKVQKLAAAKEKADVKLGKEIAVLQKVLDSATE